MRTRGGYRPGLSTVRAGAVEGAECAILRRVEKASLRNVLAVVPARLGGRRFPGKALADVGGVPMVVRVLQAAAAATCVDDAVVATSDPEIETVVRAHGGTCIRTRPDHATGTDRVVEAASRFPEAEFVFNVQGDEPLLPPSLLDDLANDLGSGFDMATPAHRLTNPARIDDPNQVKVSFGASGAALRFSRRPLPGPAYGHIGVYLFRRGFLMQWPSLPPSEGERIERLEQLRALEAGHRIQVVTTSFRPIGVDSPGDLRRVERRLSSPRPSPGIGSV